MKKKLITVAATILLCFDMVAQTFMYVKQKDGSVIKYDVDSVSLITYTASEVSVDNNVYIDLGLPSGTLWANCNLGAEKPNETGDYYSWGETSIKDYYEWESYKWSDGNYQKMSKYCSETDKKVVLDPEDDVVTVVRGAGCQIPTMEQWHELIANCQSSWIEYDGVFGCKFLAKNAAWIFLPACGMKYMNDVTGTNGVYWSSNRSLYDSDNDARGYDIVENGFQKDEADISVVTIRRYYGCLIRPVKVK